MQPAGGCSALALGPLEEGDRAADLGRMDGDELPAVLAPRVEDLLGVVRQQRNGGVLPRGHRKVLSARLDVGTTAKAIPGRPRAARRGAGPVAGSVNQRGERATVAARTRSARPRSHAARAPSARTHGIPPAPDSYGRSPSPQPPARAGAPCAWGGS